MGFLQLFTGSNRGAPVTADNPIPVTLVGDSIEIPAPVGAATEAKQDAIIAAIEGIEIPAPVGAATEAKQDDAITALGAIELATEAIQTSSAAAQTALESTNTVNVAPDSNVMKLGAADATPKFAAISASSSGDNTLVAAVTGKKIRVLAYSLMGAGAVNVRFQSAAAGDYLTGLKYIASAGGGICQPFNPVGWFETDAAELLNLELSGAVAVGGELVYIEV